LYLCGSDGGLNSGEAFEDIGDCIFNLNRIDVFGGQGLSWAGFGIRET
jgi:hypothetical protein